VFGAMRDKDLAGVIAPVLPLVVAWHVTALPTARAASADELARWCALARRRPRPKPFQPGMRCARPSPPRTH
jgi:folylpolyglutamate synthase/dihydropteroate synthase